MQGQSLFKRKASLYVVRPGQQGNNPSAFIPASVIDLSQMRFTFQTAQQDVESPNNCSIRVFNLSESTVDALTKFEYTRVILQAGYENSHFGVIFDGSIKQFRRGRLNATDTYLDILAADGDQAYNFAVINKTLAAGSSPNDRVKAVLDEMSKSGATRGNVPEFTGGVLPRGKVLFGMARALLRQQVQSQGATWNISNGQINVTPLTGYLPGEAVVLNSLTGLIGRAEQTQEGVKCTSLLNPRLEVGRLLQIDNKSINQTIAQTPLPGGSQLAFNQYSGIQNFATVTADGVYRLYVVEHEGDTRGQAWYSHLTALAINPGTNEVKPYG